MTAIQLKIFEPVHDSGYRPDSQNSLVVNFRGAVIDLPEGLENEPLYYRWYSSMNPAVAENRYALENLNDNPLTDPEQPFSKELGVGSHAITFSVSDRKDQTNNDMKAIRHGGVVGGTGNPGTNDPADGRCVIHVFKAGIIAPAAGATLSRRCTLIAECPLLWWRIKSDGGHEFNADYQKINRLKYSWKFEGENYSFEPEMPDNKEFAYDKETFPSISHTVDLPEKMPGGEYILTLYVEDKDRFLTGAGASIKCTVPNVGAP